MRYVVLIGMAVTAAILIRIKREYKGRILACFGVLMIVMGILYNVRLMDKVLPAINPVNQSFYQTRYLENGEYPDSLLMQLFKGKKVFVKDDIYYISDADMEGKNFLYAYYHSRNMYWFLERAGAIYEKDETMNDKTVAENIRDNDFVRLGYTNDMFRYCFMYNNFYDIEKEAGYYFNYYWYYYEFLDAISAYICEETDKNGDTVFTSDELVVLWQPAENDSERNPSDASGTSQTAAQESAGTGSESPDSTVVKADANEEEDIYIMTKAYYDTEVVGNE